MSTLDNWTSPVTLENKSGDDWILPAGKSANFFRVTEVRSAGEEHGLSWK